MEKPVLFEVQDEIAVLTLNRPERRNAINQSLLVHLYDAIDEVATNRQIRVAILTGKGVSFWLCADTYSTGPLEKLKEWLRAAREVLAETGLAE